MGKNKQLLFNFALMEILFVTLFFLPSQVYQENIISEVIRQNILYSSVVLIISTVIYIRFVVSFDFKKVPKRTLFFMGVVFFITAFLLKPVVSTDVLSYISRFRTISHHQSNPYTTPYANFKDDQLYNQIATVWSEKNATLGPLYAHIGSFVTRIIGNNLLATIYTLKLINLLAVLFTGYFIYRITKSINMSILYIANPLIIFELIVNSHQDALMIFFFAVSMYYVFRSRSLISIFLSSVCLVFSFLIKPFTAVLIPVYLLYFWTSENDYMSKFKTLALFTAGILLTSILIYLPFWEGLVTLKRYWEVVELTTIQVSPFVLLLMLGLNNIVDIGSAVVISGVVGKAVFIVVYTAIIIKNYFNKAVSTKKELLYVSTGVIVLFFGVFFNWLKPWYLSFAILLLILQINIGDKKEFFQKVMYGSMFYGIMLYLLKVL